MDSILNIAIRVIRIISQYILQHYQKQYFINTNSKNKKHYQYIIFLIQKLVRNSYPNHIVIHSINLNKKNIYHVKTVWIVDLIDNFLSSSREFFDFYISFIIRIKNISIISVIYNPIKNELFYAQKGNGAYFNRHRLRIKNQINIKKLVLTVQYPLNLLFNYKMLNVCFTKLYQYQYHIEYRNTHAISLNLAYVISGKINCLIFKKVIPKDCISGILLIIESGGLVIKFVKKIRNIKYKGIITGNLHIIKILQNFFKFNIY